MLKFPGNHQHLKRCHLVQTSGKRRAHSNIVNVRLRINGLKDKILPAKKYFTEDARRQGQRKYHQKHKREHNVYVTARLKKHPEKAKDKYFKREYGISFEEHTVWRRTATPRPANAANRCAAPARAGSPWAARKAVPAGPSRITRLAGSSAERYSSAAQA